MPEVLTFVNGLDASTPSDKLPEGFIQAGSNIDFSMEAGAARVRRGSALQAAVSTGTPLREIYRHYIDPGIGNSPVYVVSGTNVFRSVGYGTFSVIATVGSTDPVAASAYRQNSFLAQGVTRIQDDGTNTIEWGVQEPTVAPTIALQTLTPASVCSTWAAIEGTAGGLIGTATITCDDISLRAQLDASPMTGTNLNTNAGNTIGDFGIDYLDIWFSEPKLVTRVSRDYSISDTSYANYWHAELDVVQGFSALPTAEDLIDAQLLGTSATSPVDADSRAIARSRARQAIRPPQERLSAASETFNRWAVPRTEFELVGDAGTAGWTSIQGARIVVEALGPIEVRVRNWRISGAETYPLNDINVGYSWWESWAKLDASNAIVSESPLSPASLRTKALGARALVTCASTATGTSHGYTHKFIYAQGGYLPAPYRVGTLTGAGTTGTFTHSITDIQALFNNQPAVTNLRRIIPTNIGAISEPFQDRLFVGMGNKIAWTLPGNPTSMHAFSEATVSHAGDHVKRLHVWGNQLVIVNRDSVYEMAGTIFEGSGANYTIYRSGSRHGAGAPKAAIKTEFGIFLLNQDGFYMYVPGQGIDQPITWANERLSVIFQGAGTADPAALDGSRVPAINHSYLINSVATYKEGRLYVGCPTGTSTSPDTLYVLDFLQKRVWYYKYPWEFQSIFWDFQDNRMLIGANDGNLYRTEIGVNDTVGTAGQGVPWSLRSRAWSTPSDTLLENISCEYRGGAGVVKGVYDGTSTVTIGTLTGTLRQWLTPALNGTISNNVVFRVDGTQSDNPATIYNIAWDALQEPVRVLFYRTPHFNNEYNGDKLWDVHYSDIEIVGTGTVLATVYIDNAAVMTATHVAPPLGRQIHTTAFPFDTFGDVAHTIYNSVGGVRFKLWATSYEARNEPPRITNYQSDIQSLEENICDAVDIDINPLGTVLSTILVDNTAVQTATWIGTKRQSFTWALPNELYGRTIYANHVAQGGGLLKHYKTWFHLRPEPDRWQNFVTDKESGDESFFSAVDCDLNCLGNTVLGTAMINNAAAGTFTFTGTQRQSYVNALAEDTYGRTAWMIYNVSSGRFKHYRTWFHKDPEPDRLTLVQWGPQTFPSDSIIKTWVAELNPLGTAVGVILVEGTAISTQTFVGTRRQVYNVGLPNITVGGDVDVTYTNAARLKHYSTFLEAEAKPFGKTTWLMVYKKIGGASQLDFARFHELDAEPESGTATITSVWDIDGAAFQTNTLTFTGREWRQRVPFLPGARGSLFQQRLSSTQSFRVWHSSLDVYRVGRKGVSFFNVKGTPEEPFKLPLELPQPRVD